MRSAQCGMNLPFGSRRQEACPELVEGAHSIPTRPPGKRSEPRYLGCYVNWLTPKSDERLPIFAQPFAGMALWLCRKARILGSVLALLRICKEKE